METKPESATILDATDSSVSSLTSSFGQLEVNGQHSTGPINRLPNEMMQLVLAKLGLDGDVKKMIQLRLVSKKWRSLVEDYCGLKKFLIIIPIRCYIAPVDEVVKEEFFGLGHSKDYARLCLDTEMPSQHLRSILRLFPNIEQLSIYWREQSLVPHFVMYIYSLDSLKQLDLFGPFISVLVYLSSTLSKLEHFSFNLPGYTALHNDDHRRIISHLGPDCGRVKFDFCTRFYSQQIVQWNIINPRWLTNLTHLIVHFSGNSEEFAQVVRFLGEHAKLQLFHFQPWPFDNALQLKPNVIRALGTLTHLTELKLWLVKIDFAELEEAARLKQLPSLSSVLTLKLGFYLKYHESLPSGELITQVLSIIFPKLKTLKLYSSPYFTTNNTSLLQQQIEQQIEQHLHHFKHLLVSRFDYNSALFHLLDSEL